MPRPRAHTVFALGLLFASFSGAARGQSYWDQSEQGAPYAAQPYPDDGQDESFFDFDRPTRNHSREEPSPREARPRGQYPDPDAAQPRLGRAPRVASLPPDADPAYSTPVDFDDLVDPRQTTRELVSDPTGQPAGAITIDTKRRKLYLSLGGGRAFEYGVGVGREGFAWKGEAQIGRKAFWPGWTPPREMLLRRPDLPSHMDGGVENPLGARALYLFNGARDTMFRIHGTNEPDTIGQAVSSGCIRMLNADVIDLYGRVSKGARVVVR